MFQKFACPTTATTKNPYLKSIRPVRDTTSKLDHDIKEAVGKYRGYTQNDMETFLQGHQEAERSLSAKRPAADLADLANLKQDDDAISPYPRLYHHAQEAERSLSGASKKPADNLADLKQDEKKQYDHLLQLVLDKEPLTSIQLLEKKYMNNSLRVVKQLPLCKNKLVDVTSGCNDLLLSEAKFAHDLALRISLHLAGLEEGLVIAQLEHYQDTLPSFAMFDETSIPERILMEAKSNRNRKPFYFTNPSNVAEERRAEINERSLERDISPSFSIERKKEIALAVIIAMRNVFKEG